MDKPNTFRSSNFYMSQGDVLHMIIRDETGTAVSMELYSVNDTVNPEDIGYGELVDYDGNIYTTVVIGTQEWIIENLRVTHYSDGTDIIYVTSSTEWANGYSLMGRNYGYLYNWYAATDVRNIANAGWHVPTVANWETLKTFIGGFTEGHELKETGNIYWNAPNTGATNSLGFNGRGAGIRDNSGIYNNLLAMTVFATADAILSNYVLTYDNGIIGMNNAATSGFSVRLVKDSTTLTHGQTGTYIGNDNRLYNTICIGTQEWLSENLAETKYRDGSDISHGGADPTFYTNAEWAALTTEAYCIYDNDDRELDGFYCWYNNNIANKTAYGALYNEYAINNASGLAYFERDGVQETGWRIPTTVDYDTLTLNLGGTMVAGAALKETGITHWLTPNTGATNSSGFSARGAGIRLETDGSFLGINEITIFATSDNEIAGVIKSYDLDYSAILFGYGYNPEETGYSVRCVRNISSYIPIIITVDATPGFEISNAVGYGLIGESTIRVTFMCDAFPVFHGGGFGMEIADGDSNVLFRVEADGSYIGGETGVFFDSNLMSGYESGIPLSRALVNGDSLTVKCFGAIA